jgi:hypothetical protein
MRANETPLDIVKTLSLSRTYAAALAEIITKSNVGRQQLTKQQTALDTAIFMEVLYGKIPEHRLNECYLEAVRTRKNTFPLKPEELCVAWETIRQSEFYKRVPESRRLTHGFCEKCNNTNNEQVRNDYGVLMGARACKHGETTHT